MEELKTLEEKKKEGFEYTDRQNTKWAVEIAGKCKHKWQPIQFVMETGGIQPDLNNGKVYCVCMKCCSHTYIETGWIGYYIGSPDLLEDESNE